MPKIPAYQRIKSTILTKIHTGQWAVGSAIPTEMALSREFDVARMTVNRALKELTDEQVLERRQGSGTFVAQQRFNQTFITVRNIAHDIQKWRVFWNVRKTRLLCVCLATLIQAIKWLLLYKCGMMEPRFVLMEQ